MPICCSTLWHYSVPDTCGDLLPVSGNISQESSSWWFAVSTNLPKEDFFFFWRAWRLGGEDQGRCGKWSECVWRMTGWGLIPPLMILKAEQRKILHFPHPWKLSGQAKCKSGVQSGMVPLESALMFLRGSYLGLDTISNPNSNLFIKAVWEPKWHLDTCLSASTSYQHCCSADGSMSALGCNL